MAKAKINTKDFANLPIDKWNGTTFREYIKHLNKEKYGIPSITNSVQIENNQIKQFTKEYGNEVTKEFVEECVRQHKGNERFPTVNFSFMTRFMKESCLAKVLGQQQKKSRLQEIREQLQTEQKDVINYF